ncbi:MAG: cell division protein FtsA [Bacteroidetes bacterium]|nr:cell division protein FtsA [Bacteroidota bacterium]
MKERIITALDIGTTKVAALVARENEFGKVEILGIGISQSFGVKRGVVTNIDKTVHAIRKAVEQAEAQSGIKFVEVLVGIAGQHIKSLQHRGILVRDNVDIEIDEKDIQKLIGDMHKLSLPPGDKIIHVLPQDYIVDNEQGIKEPIGMAGVRVEGNFHIITGQAGAIHNINKCVIKAGLKVKNVVLEPLASAAAVLSKEELEAGVALVDIGGGTTDIAIFEEGIIRHTSVIPFGGDIITEDIKKGCMILRDQAESLKLKFGSALALETQDNEIVAIPGLRGRNHKEISIKNLSHIIQARMEEILEHVHFELRGSDFDKKLIGGIVLTGGGSQLKHLVQLTQLVTGMEARIGIPNEHLASTKMKEVNNPIFATGIGLAIRAFHEAELDKETEWLRAMPKEEEKEEIVEATLDIDVDEVEPLNEPEKKERNTEKNKEYEGAQSGNWLKNIITKSKQWLEKDLEDDFQDTPH